MAISREQTLKLAEGHLHICSPESLEMLAKLLKRQGLDWQDLWPNLSPEQTEVWLNDFYTEALRKRQNTIRRYKRKHRLKLTPQQRLFMQMFVKLVKSHR